MKRVLFLSSTCLALAAAAACATSEGAGTQPEPASDSDAGPTVLPDASELDASADAPPTAPSCSSAGWCPTDLPDVDLSLKDIWPLDGRAFAVAESPTSGVKVLEWTGSDGKWSYIDDSTQNEWGRGAYAGKIFAPNENEVYYTVAPRTVYHGTRNTNGAPPDKPWSWTRQALEDRLPAYPPGPSYAPEHYLGRPLDPVSSNIRVSFGVFGTNADDIHAWFGNTIYRLTRDDAGTPTWTVDYIADDLDRTDEQIVFLGATGTGPDDVWFAGGRTGGPYDYRTCAILVHKTATGYHRVLDAVRDDATSCSPRPDTAMLDGTAGWLSDVRSVAANTVVGLKAAFDLARITLEGGSYSTITTTVPILGNPTARQGRAGYLSFSAGPNQPIWLGAYSLVVRGEDVWTDGGTYAISSISLNGGVLSSTAPTGDMPVYQLRSSSMGDVWLAGDHHALHKTTP